MRIFRVSALCGLAALSVACKSDRVFEPALPHAVVTMWCGPVDQPFVALYLASTPIASPVPAPPYFRIVISESIDRLEGRSWLVASENAVAAAWHHPNTTNLEIATAGTVRVYAVSDARMVEGSVDVMFPRAGRVRNEFRASWIPPAGPCG